MFDLLLIICYKSIFRMLFYILRVKRDLDVYYIQSTSVWLYIFSFFFSVFRYINEKIISPRESYFFPIFTPITRMDKLDTNTSKSFSSFVMLNSPSWKQRPTCPHEIYFLQGRYHPTMYVLVKGMVREVRTVKYSGIHWSDLPSIYCQQICRVSLHWM